MKHALVRGEGAPLLHSPQDTPAEVAAGWVSRLSPATLRAFRADLAAFGGWLGLRSDQELLEHLREIGSHRTENIVERFITAEAERGLAPNTVAGRLTAIRSLLKVARKQRMIDWTIDVDLPKRSVGGKRVRDMSGPSEEDVDRLLVLVREITKEDEPLGRRDHAVIALLYGAALRVDEAVSLDLEHLAGDKLWVKGKGARVRAAHPAVAPWVLECVRAWITVRPPAETPSLLLSFAEPREQTARRRVSQRALRDRFAALAKRAGVEAVIRPHGLRHACATHALARGATMQAVSILLRHASVATTIDHYADDTRQAAMSAALLLTPRGA